MAWCAELSNGDDIGLATAATGVAPSSRARPGGSTGSLEFSSHDRALTATEITTLHGGSARLTASYYVVTGRGRTCRRSTSTPTPTFTEIVTEIDKMVGRDRSASGLVGPLDGFAVLYKGDFSATQPGN